MSNAKKFIVDLFNSLFEQPKEEDKRRRLIINKETGKLTWSDGEKPFGEGPDEEEIKAALEKGEEFGFEDDKTLGTRMFRPTPSGKEPFIKNRFSVEFPGIPEYYFNSYSYLGTDVHLEKKFFMSKKTVKDDYSSFKVLLLFPNDDIDICEKLKALEERPIVGDVKVNLLDAVGMVVKTILIPDCQVTEIKAFRDLSYGKCGDKSDELLFGEIVVKHKQRKLL